MINHNGKEYLKRAYRNLQHCKSTTLQLFIYFFKRKEFVIVPGIEWISNQWVSKSNFTSLNSKI